MSTHYEALDVSPDATPSEIKKAWRKIAFGSHPDRAGMRELSVAEEGKLADRFKRGVVAWEILGDEESRKAYDRELTGEDRQERWATRTAQAQAYGDDLWRRAQAERQRLEREYLRQAQQRARRNAERKRGQAERRAKERQRAADQQTEWEAAYEIYLQKIVTNLRCEIASFILDDHDA